MNASVENLIKAFTYQRFFTLFIKMKIALKFLTLPEAH